VIGRSLYFHYHERSNLLSIGLYNNELTLATWPSSSLTMRMWWSTYTVVYVNSLYALFFFLFTIANNTLSFVCRRVVFYRFGGFLGAAVFRFNRYSVIITSLDSSETSAVTVSYEFLWIYVAHATSWTLITASCLGLDLVSDWLRVMNTFIRPEGRNDNKTVTK